MAAGQLPADETCAWGCSEGGGSHCSKLVPMGGALLSQDLTPNPAFWSTTLSGAVLVNTDTGAIQGFRAEGIGVDRTSDTTAAQKGCRAIDPKTALPTHSPPTSSASRDRGRTRSYPAATSVGSRNHS